METTTQNSITLGPKASDHLHAVIAIVVGIFFGLVLPYVVSVSVFNSVQGLSDFRDALFWTALYVLPFLGLTIATWGIALLLKERKMKARDSYTPSAVFIASLLFILFSLISPHLVFFLAALRA